MFQSKYVVFRCALALSFWAGVRAVAAPLGTAFSYQGQLKSTDGPVNGIHDLRFRLFDAAVVGAQVGSTYCIDGVNVINGLFTVPLDFGAQFNGDKRFLEIQVRADGTPGNCDVGVSHPLASL